MGTGKRECAAVNGTWPPSSGSWQLVRETDTRAKYKTKHEKDVDGV